MIVVIVTWDELVMLKLWVRATIGNRKSMPVLLMKQKVRKKKVKMKKKKKMMMMMMMMDGYFAGEVVPQLCLDGLIVGRFEMHSGLVGGLAMREGKER